MVLGSNREVIVRDVTPESCDLMDFGLSPADGAVPVIETLLSVVTVVGNAMVRFIVLLNSTTYPLLVVKSMSEQVEY